MNEIIRHIEFLLVTHDCVVIPGLGAVLAHCLPASYDKIAGMMLPPSRTFSFNVTLTHNDGLLVSSVARAKGLSFEAARSLVAGEVEAMRRELDRNGVVSLGLAGRLMSSDGVLSFEPSSAASLSPAHMWLQKVRLMEVTALARQRAAEALSKEVVRPKGRVVEYASRAARIAASLIILLALGFVLSTPVKVENAQYASLGIENFTSPAADTPRGESTLVRLPGQSSSPVVLYLQAHDDACEIADTAAHGEYVRMQKALSLNADTDVAADNVTADASQSDIRFNPDDKYFLIVASLASEADADDFIANSKNRKLGILAKDGRYRVYAATGVTYNDAQSAAARLADSYSSAWVCRK